MLYTENYFVVCYTCYTCPFKRVKCGRVTTKRIPFYSVCQNWPFSLLESLNIGITSIMTWQQPNTGLKLVQLIMVDSRGKYGELKH